MPDIVAIEGPDGVGKTTLVPLLKQELEAQGLRVVVARQPGDEAIRRFLSGGEDGFPATCPEARLLAFVADRMEQLHRLLKAPEDIILLDRFSASTIVNQRDTVDDKLLRDLVRLGESQVPKSTRVVYVSLELPLELLVPRLRARVVQEMPDPDEATLKAHVRGYDDVFSRRAYDDCLRKDEVIQVKGAPREVTIASRVAQALG